MSRQRRLAALLPAIVAFATCIAVAPLAAFSAAPSATDSGGVGLRLVEAPENASGDPRAQIYIVDHLDAGMRIHREIEIANTTTADAHIALYPAAATIADGTFLGADGHTANDLSRWTSVNPPAVDVPAGGRATASVTIVVPTDAVRGERYGVVWAEAPPSPMVGSAVMQVSRVGIRLYVSVGSGEAPRADFAIDSLTARRSIDGAPSVVATVRNTGDRALDVAGSLQLLDGPAGLSAGPFPVALGVTVAIGATAPVTVALDERLPAGPWIAEIRMHSGLVEHTARATITFPDAGTATSVSTATERPRPYRAIAGLSTIALAVAVAISMAAHRRRSPRFPNPKGSRIELIRK